MGSGTPYKSVLIGVPQWGTAPPECCAYREDMRAYLAKRETEGKIYDRLRKDDPLRAELQPFPYRFAGVSVADQLITFTREQICREAVDRGYDYVAMIDDDMIGGVDLFELLLKLDVDIAAPLMFMRSQPHYPVIYAVKGGVDPEGNKRTYGTQIIRNYPKKTLIECDAVGFGAVLIKTSVLKKMPRPWFYVTNADVKGETGEDVYFCVNARKAGARVFVDSRIELKHLGPRQYIGEADYERVYPEAVTLREVAGEWSKEKQKYNLTY